MGFCGPVSPTLMPLSRSRLRPALAVAVALLSPLAAAQTAVPDSSSALRWARRAVEARQSAEARRAAQAAEARAAIEAEGAAYREAFAQFEASRVVVPTLRRAGARAVAARAGTSAAALSHLFVPVGAEALVEQQVGVVRRHFGSVQGRARRTFPMIERALRRRGLPDDLKYVAVIESALDPDAVSPAGAAGLWQFMPATAADFGLDSLGVRDPARATDAAVRYLDRLGRAFNGDWQLALAAYNCGPSRVRRLVDAHRARTGTPAPTFWDIHDALPAETRAYVPRFIAAAAHFGSRGA